jgi:hypothetical protein
LIIPIFMALYSSSFALIIFVCGQFAYYMG